MKNRMFVIPGKFVPCNDTVTLLTYRRLKHLDLDLDVFALKGDIDKGIEKELENDKNFKKFNISYFSDYEKTITINKPYLLPIGLINMFRYVKKSIRKFEEKKYKYLYTSSIPGISHICGLKIKKKHPEVKWYASISDPFKGAPFKKDPNINKRSIFYRIAFNVGSFVYMNNKYEEVAVKYADKLIFICEEQRDFTANQYPIEKQLILEKSIVLPLCYDEDWDMYKELINAPRVFNNPKKAVHLGRLYGLRRIDIFLNALKELKEEYPNLSSKIEFYQYSEIQNENVGYVKKNHLNDLFKIHERVSYDESLKIMKEADVLILFDTLMTGEPIQPYLPSKIIEYLLLNKSILAICENNSPSYRILKSYECAKICSSKEEIKLSILRILNENNNYANKINNLGSINNSLKL